MDALFHKLTHVLSCKEASRLLSQGQDRALTAGERVKLWLHLRICIACTRFSQQLAFMRQALANYRS